MEQNPPDRRSQHCCHAPPLASFSACDDQPRPWRNSEYRVGSWICGHAQCSCLHCVEALRASIYRVSARSTCRHRSYLSEAAPGPVESEFDQVAGIEGGATPGQGIFRITAQECAADIVREFERGSPVIFPGRNYRWLMKMQPLMPRRLVATHVAQAARKIRCRGNQTRSLRPSPTGHVYAS